MQQTTRVKKGVNMDLNFEEIENYLHVISNKKFTIAPIRIYTHNDCVKLHGLFSKYSKKDIISIFKGNQSNFVYEVACSYCKEISQKKGTTTEFYGYVRDFEQDKFSIMCDSCREKEIEKQKEIDRIELEKKLKQKELEQSIKNDNSIIFIKNYLDSNKMWSDSLQAKYRFNALLDNIHYCNTEYIKEYILSMEYSQFLKTPYWKAIADHTKYKAKYTCVFCDSKQNLVTHHKTYKHHGEEIFYLNDLVVLCDSCHHKHHKHEDHK